MWWFPSEIDVMFVIHRLTEIGAEEMNDVMRVLRRFYQNRSKSTLLTVLTRFYIPQRMISVNRYVHDGMRA